jgi:hypothetical protein
MQLGIMLPRREGRKLTPLLPKDRIRAMRGKNPRLIRQLQDLGLE